MSGPCLCLGDSQVARLGLGASMGMGMHYADDSVEEIEEQALDTKKSVLLDGEHNPIAVMDVWRLKKQIEVEASTY